ncbi:hypothetical protein F4804DRAFT_336027 [Jackrogersella minutella]|nr:hypothetical protein F4804DRAFT_336027 [Jackrogersella minutella]
MNRGLVVERMKNFLAYCKHTGLTPWPATKHTLVPWVTGRAFGRFTGITPYQGQIRPTTLSAYVAALRSVHVDLDLSCALFDSEYIRRLLAGSTGLFPAEPRAERAPMTKSLLVRLLEPRATANEPAADTLHESTSTRPSRLASCVWASLHIRQRMSPALISSTPN